MKKLEWEECYSVGVKEIDDQHKKLFEIINNLVEMVGRNSSKEEVMRLITNLAEYKKNHFETEEKYFKEFNYEGADEHIAEHKKLGETLGQVLKENGDDYMKLSFVLVDFLEDWLITHLMGFDQKYKECFAQHGLK